MVQTHPRRRQQRKAVGDSSDYEDEEDEAVNKTPKKQTKLPQRTLGDLASPKESPSKQSNSSAASSPRKPSRRLSKQSSNETGTRSIQSFFKPAPAQKPAPLPAQRTESIEEKLEEDEELEEIDDSTDDAGQRRKPTNGAGPRPDNPRKRSSDTALGGTLHASNKFRKAVDGSRSITEHTPLFNLSRPWTEQYVPANLEELAVHKKKVADVKQWLESVYSGKSFKRLLVLKGSAGTGKTCTTTLLGKVLGIDFMEWSNPESAGSSGDMFTSVSAQFEDFVLRSRTFTGLQMAGVDGVPIDPTPSGSEDNKSINSKQAILIEEFPNSITRSTDAVQRFRNIVSQYLAANTPGRSIFSNDTSYPTPLIMIISESVLSGNTFSSDSFTAHRLLGQELLTHPGCTVIEFNAVAPTISTKGLNLILQKHARQTGRRFSLHPQLIQKLSELGDIRNATSSLEFLCLQAPLDNSPSSIPTSKTKSKSRASKAKPKANEEPADPESLSLLNLRESTLGLFHAIGKVVYNKRTETPSAAESELPEHLPHQARLFESEVDISSLFDTTGTDVNTFIAALHENYALSCNTPATAPNSEATLETVNLCIDSLADADILDGTLSLTTGGGAHAGAETMTQASLAFEVAVRGLLFSLPFPVKRAVKPSSSGGPNVSASRSDAYRMFYPSSLRLWRRAEETTGLLDLIISRARNGTLLPSGEMIPSRSRFVPSVSGQTTPIKVSSMSQPGRTSEPSRSIYASPKGANGSFQSPQVFSAASNSFKAETDTLENIPAKLGGGESPRVEMLLDRLPYMSIMLRGRTAPSSTLLSPRGKGNEKQKGASGTARLLKELEPLTRFHGFGTPQEEDEEQPETDVPAATPSLSMRLGSGYANLALRLNGNAADSSQEKTILSDDDIEDSDS